MKSKKKKLIGGARAGSGRKKLGHSRLQLYVTPESLAEFEERAASLGLEPAKFFDQHFAKITLTQFDKEG